MDGTDYSVSRTAQRFQTMGDALLAQDRTILYSLCEWGTSITRMCGNLGRLTVSPRQV